ncbi:MAG: hypothetical protein P4M15_06535 [Alphaproteobacteria bacterium]|nr:hypothetical protein [Alphaproteobacteria bacterium]
MAEDAHSKRSLGRTARYTIGLMLCLILGVGWMRALFTVFGWLMIALLFNDSGASEFSVVASVVSDFGGLAIIFLLITSTLAISLWLINWHIFAIVVTIPVFILDMSPAGTLKRVIDTVRFSRDELIDHLSGNPLLVAYEKNLCNEPDGIGTFAWSPESGRIAYTHAAGRIRITSLESGNVSADFESNMQRIESIAWSSNGQFLAINSATKLTILKADNFEIINSVDVQDPQPDGAYIRFKRSAFFEDGSALLLENYNQGSGDTANIVLYRFDLGTGVLKPALTRPNRGDVRDLWDGGIFQRHMGHLYYSSVAYRGAERIFTHKIVGHEDRGVILTPATCFVFDFEARTDEPSVRSMAFPPQGQLPMSIAEYIASCEYSPSSDRVVVIRQSPFFMDGVPALALGPLNRFYESHDLAAIGPSPEFGGTPAPEEGQIALPPLAFHPTKPWLLSVARPTTGKLLTVWDVASGHALSRVRAIGEINGEIRISPDGHRAAAVTGGDNLSIYKFNIQN